jgi:GT2 family glycosyltransferase
MASALLLAGVVAHWHGEDDLERLLAAWPRDPRFELVVVDNGSTRLAPLRAARPDVTWIEAGRNLGFGGAVNRGVEATRAELLLFLNPDAAPRPGALPDLLAGFARRPDAAGIVPKLLSPDGAPQNAWQLAPLPTRRGLMAQAFFLPRRTLGQHEPEAGAAIEQPAAAALALRRSVFETVGGFDAGFHPAWFEDVDLAARLRAAGHRLLYWPASVFEHRLGSTLPRLGYGAFLAAYDRNLVRYARKHHGPAFAFLLAAAVRVGALARLILVPLRRPRRARSRAEAARALVSLALLGTRLRE